MSALKLDIHQSLAQTLYEQHCNYREQPLVAGSLLLSIEKDLLQHLHVLSRCQPEWPEINDRGSAFLHALGHHSKTDHQDWLVSRLCQAGSEQHGVFDALCWDPSLLTMDPLVKLYNDEIELRPLLFDLWRHRQDQIPTGLISAAELRSKNVDLQIAALRYAASRKEIGHDLFIPYFRDFNSGAKSNLISGKLLATALWGSLLRGTGQFYEPLWRGIETEDEPSALYSLLRIGALIATPELPRVIQQYSKDQPGKAAELLALHGTKEAIDTLAGLTAPPEAEAEFKAAWLWLSGQQLHFDLRMQVAGNQDEVSLPKAVDWWDQQREQLIGNQRLFFGHLLTPERVYLQARLWGGYYSINLIDLLCYLQKKPVEATERIRMRQRQQLLVRPGAAA